MFSKQAIRKVCLYSNNINELMCHVMLTVTGSKVRT